MKKISLILTAILTAGVVFTGCGNKSNTQSKVVDQNKEPRTLVISTWGYNEDKLRKNVFEPFEKANNVKIVLEVGNNAERLNKIKNMSNSKIDIIFLADSFSMEGVKAGLFEKINKDNIPNLKNIYDVAKATSADGYGPAYTINRTGIIYDSKAVSKPLESWKDLWQAELKGKITVSEITSTAGPALIAAAANIAGTTIEKDYNKAFVEMVKLKPNIVKTYSKSSDLVNMFTQGEIVAGVAQDFAFGQIKAALPSAKWLDPKEGAYANLNTINIVKGSKNKELAEKFIDWSLSEKVQKANALDKIDSPVNVNVILTEKEAEGLTYGKEIIAGLKTLDLNYINSVKTKWIDKWNKEISN